MRNQTEKQMGNKVQTRGCLVDVYIDIYMYTYSLGFRVNLLVVSREAGNGKENGSHYVGLLAGREFNRKWRCGTNSLRLLA